MDPEQQPSAPGHADACVLLSLHDRAPTGHEALREWMYFSCTLYKGHVSQLKEGTAYIETRTFWCVTKVGFDFRITVMACWEDTTFLHATSRTEYLVIHIKETLGWMYQLQEKHLRFTLPIPQRKRHPHALHRPRRLGLARPPTHR